MTEWQPIETAPKNGTEILGYLPNRGVIMELSWSESEADPNMGDWIGYDACGSWLPSHWMPLPEAPEEESL